MADNDKSTKGLQGKLFHTPFIHIQATPCVLT